MEILTNQNNFTENMPNAAKLIQALRNTGYDNYAAIADLIDNSFDADANNVWIDIVPTSDDFIITIADDGNGMDADTLDQAMRLGSQIDKNSESDLGKFGMGLITASLSISRRLTVITKNNDYLTAIQDIDSIIESNHFEKELRPASNDEETRFKEFTHNAKNGTLVLLEKCDRIQDTNINQLSAKLVKEISQIFRYFLQSGKNIYVRGNKVRPFDPLMLEDKLTEIYSDEQFQVESKNKKENLRIKIALLPNFDSGTAKIKEINISNQGFYLLRNNREIASGVTLGIFTKHNDYNRLRVELFFTGNIDDLMGITFNKRDFKPQQKILDKIQQLTYPQIASIRNKIKKAQVVSESETINHDKAAKIITEKSMLLIKPKAQIGIRGPIINHPGTTKTKDTDRTQHPTLTRERIINKVNCIFDTKAMGSSNFFEVDQVGKTILVTYNAEHPFYSKFVLANKDDQEVVNALDFLVYSLASAKLISAKEDNMDLFEGFMSIFSSNLKTLIN